MDTQSLVRTQVEDGERWLSVLKTEGFPVRAAYWARRADEERWLLYLATPESEETGKLETVKYVLQSLQSLGEVSFRGSDVLMLVNENDPTVRDVVDFQRRFPDLTRKKLKGQRLGGRIVDVYVYPLREVPVTLYGLYYEEDPRPALSLAFEPHPATKRSMIVGEGREEYPAKTGHDYLIAAPEGAKLERDEYRMLVLSVELRGKKVHLNPNEVLAFAHLGQHGFRILREPGDDASPDKTRNQRISKKVPI